MIPTIIHQIWIGNLPRPKPIMDSWIAKHPNFQYILWDNARLSETPWICKDQMSLCREWCGIADIMRLEILAKYGGVFIDADSYCVESLNEFIMNNSGFAAFENEILRPGLIANGMIGFPPRHSILLDMIAEIASGKLDTSITELRAWQVTGPTLLTRFLETGNYKNICVFPSFYFFPQHHIPGAPIYDGHKKVYSHQMWGTSNQSYHELQNYDSPPSCLVCPPPTWVSILITSYNTQLSFIQECLDSIRIQTGYFGMQIVWVNDGSDANYTKELETQLEKFKQTSRFCDVVYLALEKNGGVAQAINHGLKWCSHDLIFKMDSDDIMYPTRILKQMEYMNENKDCKICGCQIKMFRENNHQKEIVHETHHDSIVTLQKVILQKSKWFANHPTICFRKSLLDYVGGYCEKKELSVIHDYEWMLRVLRIEHMKVHNLQESLLLYRLHGNQLTHGLSENTETQQLLDQILLVLCTNG